MFSELGSHLLHSRSEGCHEGRSPETHMDAFVSTDVGASCQDARDMRQGGGRDRGGCGGYKGQTPGYGSFVEPSGRFSDELGAWSVGFFEDDGLFMVRDPKRPSKCQKRPSQRQTHTHKFEDDGLFMVRDHIL
jgi:hypothetical protein